MVEQVQRYVSNELTHFVGRDEPGNIDLQFGRLVSILEDKCLKPNGWSDDPGAATRLQFNPDGILTEESLVRSPNVVCFCDIPIPDFPVHMRKYGRIGLAFSKRYLLRKGASPVFYVARDADWEGTTLGEYYNELASHMVGEVFRGPTMVDGHVQMFLGRALSLMKFFRARAPETDPEHTYMEREWRIHGKLDFTMRSVRQVIMPRNRFHDFRETFPDYMGELIAAMDPRPL